MGIVQALRRAEEQARKAARAGMERTIVGLDDAERAIRRRMRIYPREVNVIRARAAASSANAAGSPIRSQPAGQELKNPSKAS